MTDIHFHIPETLDGALGLLDEHGDAARLFAGGTAMVTLLKQSLLFADHLVSLQRVPGLDGIRLEDDGLHIGALTRHRDVETSDLVRVYAPLLADVYSRVATVRIRNAATVGGGLAHADPAQDPPAALIALDARVRLESLRGTRDVPVGELFVDYYETAIEPGEAITELIVPRQPADAGAAYLKFLPRTEDDYATVAVAALARSVDGHARDVRVALIAAGPTPVRATAVERELEGAEVTPEAIRHAAAAVADEVDPLDDFRGSAEYKRDMAVVFTRRALEGALRLEHA